jgi:hypothetical protein
MKRGCGLHDDRGRIMQFADPSNQLTAAPEDLSTVLSRVCAPGAKSDRCWQGCYGMSSDGGARLSSRTGTTSSAARHKLKVVERVRKTLSKVKNNSATRLRGIFDE